MGNLHDLPPGDKYCGKRTLVDILQLISFTAGGSLGVALGIAFAIGFGRGIAIVFFLFFVIWVWVTVLFGWLAAFLTTVIAGRLCSKISDEERRLIKLSSPLEWNRVTKAMTEYLKKKRRNPWIAEVMITVSFVVLSLLDCPFAIFVPLMVFVLIGAILAGYVQLGDSMKCLSSDTEYAVAEVHRTFSYLGGKYAAVYLPCGRRVYKVKSLDVKKLVFLSRNSETRLVCDEEFLKLTDLVR